MRRSLKKKYQKEVLKKDVIKKSTFFLFDKHKEKCEDLSGIHSSLSHIGLVGSNFLVWDMCSYLLPGRLDVAVRDSSSGWLYDLSPSVSS